MIYIMYAIAYFVMTTTFLSGAATFRYFFNSDPHSQARVDNDSSGIQTASSSAKLASGTASKKAAVKKPVAPLLKAEKKELQMNNFYQNAKRTR